MRVISLKLLRDFWRHHPDAERPLRQWYKTALQADWQNLQEVRSVYPYADGVSKAGETLTAFNVGGNKYKGNLTSTEDGNTYSGTVVMGASSLQLSGCVLGGLICKNETWSRVH